MPGVPCRDRRATRLSNAGNQRVTEISGPANPLSIRGELSGRRCGRPVEVQDAVRKILVQHLIEGALEAEAPPTSGKRGSNARPNRVSNTVILVTHTESAGWRSSQFTTAVSGDRRPENFLGLARRENAPRLYARLDNME